MVIYSIKDIEEITGIKAHTLRIWEKRYKIITPHRTDTNIRYYSEDQLKKLLNISFLNKNGYKISKISSLEDKQIQTKVAKLSNVDSQVDNQLDALTLALVNLDGASISLILDKYIESIGFEKTMDLIINPFLEKLSTLWLTNIVKGVHESFITEILKQKTIIEIDKLPPVKKNARKVLLYLPENEKQQLSIEFLIYLLRSKGIETLLAGFDLSLKDVLDAYQIFKPDYIYTIINEDSDTLSFDAYLEFLCKTIDPCIFLYSGFKVMSAGNALPHNCKSLNDLDSAIKYLTE